MTFGIETRANSGIPIYKRDIPKEHNSPIKRRIKSFVQQFKSFFFILLVFGVLCSVLLFIYSLYNYILCFNSREHGQYRGPFADIFSLSTIAPQIQHFDYSYLKHHPELIVKDLITHYKSGPHPLKFAKKSSYVHLDSIDDGDELEHIPETWKNYLLPDYDAPPNARRLNNSEESKDEETSNTGLITKRAYNEKTKPQVDNDDTNEVVAAKAFAKAAEKLMPVTDGKQQQSIYETFINDIRRENAQEEEKAFSMGEGNSGSTVAENSMLRVTNQLHHNTQYSKIKSNIAGLPPAFFYNPSSDLAKLIHDTFNDSETPLTDQETTIFKFGETYPVRSTLNSKRFNIIFESVLGSGGQGVVLLAHEALKPDLKFAVKIFRMKAGKQRSSMKDDERLKRRIRWETAILRHAPSDIPHVLFSQVSHIVMPLDIVEPIGDVKLSAADQTKYSSQWVIFEYFAGDLAMVRKLPYASARARLSVTRQIIMSLMRMHDIGMVHSDVKTANFLVHHDGRIFVADFSLSHPLGDASSCTEGTLRFLPPENFRCQVERQRHIIVDQRKDTWALGVVLYRIWCYNSYPYDMHRLKVIDVAEHMYNVKASELDFSDCSGDTPLVVLHLLRLMLEPSQALRPTPRDLYETHPVFTQPTNESLKVSLEDFIAKWRWDNNSTALN